MVSESYLREDLAVEGGVIDNSASALLDWAQAVADGAAPEDIYRNKEGRKTLRFQLGKQSWFLKLHTGVGWPEIFKNLVQGRLPVLGASNEYRAVEALRGVGVDTMCVAAYARKGRNPARQRSMIVTDDLVGTVSLEDYCADWGSEPPPFATRLKIIRKLADSAGRMHRAGINHRDFYLCHFHLEETTLDDASPRCYLIDLHRAQLRQQTPRRWQVKDLAGLYFSAMDCGITRRDLLRFIAHYSDGGLRRATGQDAGLWRDVARRAQRLYFRENGCEPPAIPGVI